MAPATFADHYRSVQVPIIFEPWATKLIRRSDPKAEEHILDLACGTGVVTRQVTKHARDPASLVGVDHSGEMLGVARALAAQAGLDAEWIQADAGDLKFDTNRFDVAFCQQALQFFPDRSAALLELRRVIKPGDRFAFCVQQGLGVNPMLKAQAAALDAHVEKKAGDAVRAICGLPDGSEIRRLFENTGFQDVVAESITLTLHHANAKAFAAGAMGGMHTGDKLSGLPDGAVERAVEAFLLDLGDCVEMHYPAT